MQQRSVGASGLRVSRLGLGTMTWGRETDEHEARDLLTAFVGAGGTLVDTAGVYTDGRAEELLGELIGPVVARDDLVLATKSGLETRRGRRHVDASRGRLLSGLDASLRRLGTDHVDLWQVHAPDPYTPVEETLAALDHAVATGRARYVGLSNHAGWQVAQAATWQRAVPGRTPIVSNQVEYSLLNRSVELDTAAALEALEVGLFAWSPLGRGVLTGKYRTGLPSDSRAASEHWRRFVEAYLDERAGSVVGAVVRAAEGLDLSPTQVALAWLRDRPLVTAPIVGARTTAQLREALRVEDVVLPAEITAALDDVSAD
ncbi:aldo/keto reductase [Nocardioides bruguierae]|uniref:Aldo/keto reductase n=1 Tax=Nocardioides bruguierae TaxID=2945102 RepID=A0A9X2D523_9ACTN|nr:aldo/keto reductase [Nocardioides bruguierae]MCL8025847.1 aldo/keto reductase [Nocardioides bruguierae]MCM0618962.1 aldo/keto reductase [Nocardioides bruguierae]